MFNSTQNETEMSMDWIGLDWAELNAPPETV